MIGTQIKKLVESEAFYMLHTVYLTHIPLLCFSVSVQFVHFGPEKPYLGSGQLSIHPHKNV